MLHSMNMILEVIDDKLISKSEGLMIEEELNPYFSVDIVQLCMSLVQRWSILGGVNFHQCKSCGLQLICFVLM